MPLVGFTPTKARLVLEENKESVLVMKVALAKGESVELATGGTLQALAGVLRIRERRTDKWQGNGKGVGSLVFVDAGRGGDQESAKFQINISISTKKFDALLKIAISGRLPSKFFVDAGEKVSRNETRGMTYKMAPGGRTKVWDNQSFAFLPVTNFSAIIPITVPEPPAGSSTDAAQSAPEPPVSYGQVVDLAEDLAVFRTETNHTLMTIVSLFAVLALMALLFNLIHFFW
ncbi:MAG: hypothetical protein M3Z74_00875 [Pseudomonadota bacterium]|nr:hypothetical protein [Pseudomonadota bacterium]